MASPALALARRFPSGVPALRDGVRAVLGSVFGPPSVTADRDPGDPGLFGPGSASWEVLGEPAAIVGGIRALLVQVTHPLAVAGVAEHSRFREDPLGRLRTTSAYVTTLTFGSTSEALRVTRMVRAAHRMVRGVAPDGRAYAADDPDLLAWVGLSLTASFLATHAAFAPYELDPARSDALVAEQSRGAALLDPRFDLDALAADPDAITALRDGTLALPMIEDGWLPTTVAELDATVARYADVREVGPQGREALRFLLTPGLPAPAYPGYVPLLLGALATLPRDTRRMLGVPMPRPAAAVARANTRTTLALLRAASGPSPTLAAARERATAEGEAA